MAGPGRTRLAHHIRVTAILNSSHVVFYIFEQTSNPPNYLTQLRKQTYIHTLVRTQKGRQTGGRQAPPGLTYLNTYKQEHIHTPGQMPPHIPPPACPPAHQAPYAPTSLTLNPTQHEAVNTNTNPTSLWTYSHTSSSSKTVWKLTDEKTIKATQRMTTRTAVENEQKQKVVRTLIRRRKRKYRRSINQIIMKQTRKRGRDPLLSSRTVGNQRGTRHGHKPDKTQLPRKKERKKSLTRDSVPYHSYIRTHP